MCGMSGAPYGIAGLEAKTLPVKRVVSLADIRRSRHRQTSASVYAPREI